MQPHVIFISQFSPFTLWMFSSLRNFIFSFFFIFRRFNETYFSYQYAIALVRNLCFRRLYTVPRPWGSACKHCKRESWKSGNLAITSPVTISGVFKTWNPYIFFTFYVLIRGHTCKHFEHCNAQWPNVNGHPYLWPAISSGAIYRAPPTRGTSFRVSVFPALIFSSTHSWALSHKSAFFVLMKLLLPWIWTKIVWHLLLFWSSSNQ